MKPHIVRQCDYLSVIAARYAVTEREIWSHSANSRLASIRKNPQVLLPGDIVHVPLGESRTGPRVVPASLNTFVIRRSLMKIPLTFEAYGESLADEPFLIRGCGDERRGRTDAKGGAVVEVPLGTTSFTVWFVDVELSVDVQVGALDPVESESGLRQRLVNLGYLPAPDSARLREVLGHDAGNASEREVADAVSAFLSDHAVDPGERTEALIVRLLMEAHGS